jgi:hypothetical protein
MSPRFDDIIREDAADFNLSGLMTASLISVGRLSVVDEAFRVFNGRDRSREVEENQIRFGRLASECLTFVPRFRHDSMSRADRPTVYRLGKILIVGFFPAKLSSGTRKPRIKQGAEENV